ncbi:hypothetical protein B0H14DRAFT_3433524 [Mycena olivaceomarginata]|nr:hypothetical protein B0H14DRAFT_3433524 [Mycena olivaceomarginata]
MSFSNDKLLGPTAQVLRRSPYFQGPQGRCAVNKLSERQVSRPVPAGLIDFEAAGLPEYVHCYAIVIDSLFPDPELTSILSEAERQPWKRIIHDLFELSSQIFDKIRPHLSAIEEIEEPVSVYLRHSGRHIQAVQKWRMVRMNERLRFLRYPKGGFFRAHVDGCYENEENGQRTFYMVQLYLPSDTSGSDESFKPAGGGSTRFWGEEVDHYADVEALPGRVLIFQHDDLLHTGQAGVKCAMRSDILYEKVGGPVPVAEPDLPPPSYDADVRA